MRKHLSPNPSQLEIEPSNHYSSMPQPLPVELPETFNVSDLKKFAEMDPPSLPPSVPSPLLQAQMTMRMASQRTSTTLVASGFDVSASVAGAGDRDGDGRGW